MRDFCFIDKTFDNTQAGNYHLSIQISLDGIFFTILDLARRKYIVLAGYNFFLKSQRSLLKQVKSVLEREEMIRQDYQSIEILYATNFFSLIPSAFYFSEYSSKFMRFNHPIENECIIRSTYLQRSETWCIYVIPGNLGEYLFEKFPKANIRHDLYPLIESGLKENLNYPLRIQVHLNFFRDRFEIATISGPKLLQCNIFNFKNEKDIIFYILYVFDQLKLSPEESEIIIHGHLPQVSPLFHLLKKYVRHTSFAKCSTNFQRSYTFNDLPEHYFTTLLNTFKCE